MLGESEDTTAPAPGSADAAAGSSAALSKAQLEDEEFYTRGSKELVATRRWIAKDSWGRAQRRLAGAKRRREDPAEAQKREDLASSVLSHITRPRATASQHGDVRPVCCAAFSRAAMGADFGDAFTATGSWSSLTKIWSADACGHLVTLRAHTERVVDVNFRPGADLAPLAALERLRLERKAAAREKGVGAGKGSSGSAAGGGQMDVDDDDDGVAKTAVSLFYLPLTFRANPAHNLIRPLPPSYI